MFSGALDMIFGTDTGKKEKIEIPGFTIGSQYACTKCITFCRISKNEELQLGDHLCFEKDFKFYHAIIADISINSRDRSKVQLEIIHASNKIQINLAKKLFGSHFELHDKVSIDVLPEINLRTANTYIVKYGRKTYKNEKVLKRALTQVQRNRDRDVPLGSLSSHRIRTEAYTHNIDETTSGHFAFWCVTGETFSFDDVTEESISIEYRKRRKEISMTVVYDGVRSASNLIEVHNQRLICDKCFLTDLVRLINDEEDPESIYKFPIDETPWIFEREIPCGWYRVKYKPMNENVVIRIKRYSSRFRRLALVSKIETFSFTLSRGQKCLTECEVIYKFPYGIVGPRDINEENF